MTKEPKVEIMHALSRVYAAAYSASRANGRSILDALDEARMAVDDFTNAARDKLS